VDMAQGGKQPVAVNVDFSSDARPRSRLVGPHHGLDMQDGHHDVRPPGSRSIPLALNIWQSHGSTNRKPAREERTESCPVSKSTRRLRRNSGPLGTCLESDSSPANLSRVTYQPDSLNFLLEGCWA
jgi:hypothetical protein